MKLVYSQPKWLVGLIILVVAALLFDGCIGDGRDNGVMEGMPVNVTDNHPPLIDSLTMTNSMSEERPLIEVARTANIQCVASDPDGDKLSYAWWAARGGISGEGPDASWVAPNSTGAATIIVTVTDGKGGKATEGILISVCDCCCE